jgi:hypothetical protein
MTAAAIMVLARRTPYLEAEMLGLRDLVGPGSVCVDVGAAAGLYTQALSRLAGPSGQVHSVEPLSFVHPVATLDGLGLSLGLDRLDFIKIDVEGAELSVLQGAEQVIEAFRPALLVEIEARHTARYEYGPDDLADWLARRGYAMYAWQGRWREAGRVDAGTRNYLFRAAGVAGPGSPDQRGLRADHAELVALGVGQDRP